MNRVEFMKQLEALLYDITSSEKVEAIQYYNDYFDDAGVENEAEVINELGTPEKVAMTIKESHGIKEEAITEESNQSSSQGKNVNNGFTHNGFSDSNRNFQNAYGNSQGNNQGNSQGNSQGNNQGNYQGNSQGNYQGNNQGNYQGNNNNKGQNFSDGQIHNNGNTALIIIIGIFTFPIWFPVLMGLLGTAFGIVIALFGLVFGFGLAGILLIITSIVLLGFSIVKLVFAPLGGLCLVGISLLLCGIAILMCMLAAVIAFRLIPAICRGVFKLCQMPFRNKGGCVA